MKQNLPTGKHFFIILEHDSIIRDMETIKVEWEKRARAAEKNLVSLLKETDESQATAKKLKKEVKVLRKKNQADELEFLTRIKTQQGAYFYILRVPSSPEFFLVYLW